MKKIVVAIIVICTLLSGLTFPIEASHEKVIIIDIKDAENLYLLSIENKTMKVKTISKNLYTKISCLDNEYSTLKSVDFTSSYTCLLNTIKDSLNIKIDNYVSVNMNAILKEVDLKQSEYDYKSLASLTSTAKKILKHFKLSMIIHYYDFIDTDLNVNDLYDLYQFFHKEKFNTKYYYLNYFVISDKYYLLNTDFLLQK